MTCYTIFGTTLGDRLLDELRSKATATEEELKRNAEIAQKVTLAAVWRLGDERLRDYGHIALFATKFHDHQGWVLEVEDINRKLERASSQETGSGPEDTAVKDLSEALRKLSPPMFWLDLPDHESGGIMGHPVHEDPVWRAYQKSVNEAWPYMRRGSLSTYERHLEFRRHVETFFFHHASRYGTSGPTNLEEFINSTKDHQLVEDLGPAGAQGIRQTLDRFVAENSQLRELRIRVAAERMDAASDIVEQGTKVLAASTALREAYRTFVEGVAGPYFR